ncbi:hypothetical protein MOQ72_28990 [Saccharopolyspora sp. K220]|uniref:hypothetical protein n=1 Tax=Saccharopolyspora soli TaxID=2926618 RepID=UPI001F59E546|nr:hypothetical protein [Saccharopolyspora soli]MCI2421477.1 hypothetical protein [Saccharopolyspora soli]
MSDRLDEIKARAKAASAGPWHWAGNTDAGDPYLANWRPGYGRCTVMGHVHVERTSNDRALVDGLCDVPDEDRADVIDNYLHDAYGEPRHDERLAFPLDLWMKPARDMAVYQVAPQATSRDDERVYRADIKGIRHPDAEFIAHSRADIDWLVAEVERLRAEVSAVRELHRPDEDGDCTACGVDTYEEPIPWPCVTVRAVDDASAVTA